MSILISASSLRLHYPLESSNYTTGISDEITLNVEHKGTCTYENGTLNISFDDYVRISYIANDADTVRILYYKDIKAELVATSTDDVLEMSGDYLSLECTVDEIYEAYGEDYVKSDKNMKFEFHLQYVPNWAQ